MHRGRDEYGYETEGRARRGPADQGYRRREPHWARRSAGQHGYGLGAGGFGSFPESYETGRGFEAGAGYEPAFGERGDARYGDDGARFRYDDEWERSSQAGPGFGYGDDFGGPRSRYQDPLPYSERRARAAWGYGPGERAERDQVGGSFADRDRGAWGSMGSADGHEAGGRYGRSYERRSLRGEEGWQDGPSYAGKGPKGYRRSDERIREDVSERMSDHPGLDASELEVDVRDGRVSLRGEVDERRFKRLAESCCDDVPGVEDVANEIRVRRRDASAKGPGNERSQRGRSVTTG